MPRTKASKELSCFVAACRERKVDDFLRDRGELVNERYSSFIRNIDPSRKIYGLNTFPGHKEGQAPSPDYISRYQSDLIENHCLPGKTFFPNDFGIFVSFAKAYSISSGSTLVSGDLYRRLLTLLPDRNYAPQIPRNLSYSSGDVIPASHWARCTLQLMDGYRLQPGEGMALINGSFVHVGGTAWAFTHLDRIWQGFLQNSHLFFSTFASVPYAPLRGDDPELSRIFDFLYEGRKEGRGDSQGPVSIRCTEEIVSAFYSSLQQLVLELEASLRRPSGNPLIVGDENPVSMPSGSFVNPGLSLIQGQVIDAILMLAWYVYRRIEYLLSGSVENVARDLSDTGTPLGWIQWPKAARAKLERMRSRYSRRVFVSGDSTSHGVEDFWSNGLSLVEDMESICQEFEELLDWEHAVIKAAGAGQADTEVSRSIDAGNPAAGLEQFSFIQASRMPLPV